MSRPRRRAKAIAEANTACWALTLPQELWQRTLDWLYVDNLFVLAQVCKSFNSTFDAAAHTAFVADCRRIAGVPSSIPVLPGVLPLFEPAQFRRLCRQLHITVPAALDAALSNAEGTSEAALRALSDEYLAKLMRELSASGAEPPHVYTLNSADVLRSMGDAGFRPLKHRKSL